MSRINRLSRPTALKIAAAITVVLRLIEILIYALPDLIRGAAPVDQVSGPGGGPPFAIVLFGFVVSIVAIVAAYGTWRGQKWGIVLLIIMTVLGMLQGMLGFLGAPQLATRLYALIGVVVELLVIALCLWRAPIGGGIGGR